MAGKMLIVIGCFVLLNMVTTNNDFVNRQDNDVQKRGELSEIKLLEATDFSFPKEDWTPFVKGFLLIRL